MPTPIFSIAAGIKFALLALLFIAITACTKSEELIFDKRDRELPTRVFNNAHVVYKDSGLIKINLRSNLIEEYGAIDTPYTLFPKGVELNYYNKNPDSPGYLRADWGMMKESEGWYEGRGNVLFINEAGDTLKTQKLFWNQKMRKIYTADTVYITTVLGDSLQANDGLEAKDDLSEYKLFNNKGSKKIEETKF